MAIANTIANTIAATVTNLFKMMRCTMPPLSRSHYRSTLLRLWKHHTSREGTGHPRMRYFYLVHDILGSRKSLRVEIGGRLLPLFTLLPRRVLLGNLRGFKSIKIIHLHHVLVH